MAAKAKGTDDKTRPAFGPVKTRRVFEEICDQIRREVAAGTLRPGDKLPAERELALQFGASRTAVREALRSLEIAGVVGLQKGVKGGAFILDGNPTAVTQSIHDMLALGRISLDNLTEARMLTEQVVIRLACERATEEDFDALDRNIDVQMSRLRKKLVEAGFPEDGFKTVRNAGYALTLTPEPIP